MINKQQLLHCCCMSGSPQWHCRDLQIAPLLGSQRHRTILDQTFLILLKYSAAQRRRVPLALQESMELIRHSRQKLPPVTKSNSTLSCAWDAYPDATGVNARLVLGHELRVHGSWWVEGHAALGQQCKLVVERVAHGCPQQVAGRQHQLMCTPAHL